MIPVRRDVSVSAMSDVGGVEPEAVLSDAKVPQGKGVACCQFLCEEERVCFGPETI